MCLSGTIETATQYLPPTLKYPPSAHFHVSTSGNPDTLHPKEPLIMNVSSTWLSMDGIEKIFVMGGQLIVTQAPSELITVLGSCVSVCLWDKKTKTGGMNHYLLPASSKENDQANNGLAATKMLIQRMVEKMSSLKNIEARIFGGGNRFFSNNFLTVGQQNVDAARKVLSDHGIPVVFQDTGGEVGRKICFDTRTGSVIVQIIDSPSA